MEETSREQKASTVAILLCSVFIISICGILYELLISSIASYFQGSSILHFSIVIGLFLSFMGVGSYASKFMKHRLLDWFIRFEVVLSLVGGCSTLILYMAFSLTPYFYLIAFLLIATLGFFIGIEIPMLTRILRQYENLKDALAKVLSFDYLGALFASVIFPLLLLPYLGLMKTAFAIGLLNLIVAVINTYLFQDRLANAKLLYFSEAVVGLILVAGFAFSFQLSTVFEQKLYRDPIMLSQQTPYQKLVLTHWNQDVRLYINMNLQFSSVDEYRYHEALVHIPLATAQAKEKVLILGGGDGLAAREVLRYPEVKSIEIVDLDPGITDLATTHPVFTKLNKNSMQDPRVTVHNQDAFKFVESSSALYDVVLIDLPDPNNASLGKLYSVAFYKLLQKRLAAGGVLVTQSTSPYYAPKAFWCIHQTLEAVFDTTIPYQVYVPSFGQWGFNMAINPPHLPYSVDRIKARIDYKPLRFLNAASFDGLFQFDEDSKEVTVETNRLINQVLIQYYEKSWDKAR